MKLQNIITSKKTLDFDNLKNDRELAQQLQSKLIALGLLSGVADGLYGPKTKGALEQFANIFNLPHKLSPEFVKHLAECKVLPKSKPPTLPACGVELIKRFEGCLKDVGGGWLEVYPDPKTGGVPWTVGWGSTRKLNGEPFKPGDRITKAEADSLLLHQLEHSYYSKLQATIPYWNEMSENQRGALLSFCYNLGAAFFGSPNFNTITNLLKTKQWASVPNALMLYRNPGTRVELGLKRRRFAEGLLWQGMSVEEAYSKAIATTVL